MNFSRFRLVFISLSACYMSLAGPTWADTVYPIRQCGAWVASHGGEVRFCDVTDGNRWRICKEVMTEEGPVLICPPDAEDEMRPTDAPDLLSEDVPEDRGFIWGD